MMTEFDALSQVSPITIPSQSVTEISSLNVSAPGGNIQPLLGYHALVGAATFRVPSPARSIGSSAASSTGSGAARARAQRYRERAAQLDRQAEEEERELFELGIVEDVESFERQTLHSAANHPLPNPVASPRVYGMDPAAQQQIDQAAEVIRAGQREVEQASMLLQAQAQRQAGQVASAQLEFERVQQQQIVEAARMAQQQLELRNQFEADALARRSEIVDAQSQFHRAQMQLNIQRQQVELREQEIRVRQEEIQRMRAEFTTSLTPTAQQTAQHPPPKAKQQAWVPTVPKVPNPLKAAFPPTAPMNKAAAQFIPFATPQFPQNYPNNPFHFIGEQPPLTGDGSYHTAAEPQDQAGVAGWDDWDENWRPAPTAGEWATPSTRHPPRYREKELKLKAMPTAKSSLDWWFSTAGRVKAAAARDDDSTQHWLAQVRDPTIPIEVLAIPGSFFSVDSLISSAVDDVVTGALKSEFQREELRLNLIGRSLSGRVKLRMIMGQFDIPLENSRDQAVRCISQVHLTGGFQGVKPFLASWDEVVLQGGGTITEFQLRSNFRAQLRGVPEFDLDCLLYDRLDPASAERTYASLRRAVDAVVENRRCAAIEQELVPGRRAAASTGSGAAATTPVSPVISKQPSAKAANAAPAVKAVGKSSVRPKSEPRSAAELKGMQCYAFRDGRCEKGASCQYSHEVFPKPKAKLAATRPPGKAKAASTAKPSRAGSTPRADAQICYDFQSTRGCTRHNCKFVHVAKAAIGAAVQS